MSRAGAAGRIALVEAAAGILGVPAGEWRRSIRASSTQDGKSVGFADIVKSEQGRQPDKNLVTKAYSADESKAITLKTPDQYTLDRQGTAAARHSLQGQRHGQIRHRTMLPGMVYGRIVTPPVRYGAKVTASTTPRPRKSRATSRRSWSRTDRHDDGLGRRRRQDLSARRSRRPTR